MSGGFFFLLGAARILLVDDEPLVLNVVGSMLTRVGGLDVLPAAGARQALEIVRKQAPIDLVLSDIDMPEMRGPELVREVRRVSPGTSTVLTTGGVVDSEEIPPETPLLLKPLSTQRLIDTVREALARSAQARADLSREYEKAARLRRANAKSVSELQTTIEAVAENVRKAQERVKGIANKGMPPQDATT